MDPLMESTVGQWLRRVRGAVLLGLTWAVVWAPIAVVIGTQIVDPDNSMDEMWVAIGAYPGFLCGVVFCALLGLVQARCRLEDVTLARAATLGALSGIAVGALPFLIGTYNPEFALTRPVIVGSFTLLGALSAVGSALVARIVSRRKLSDPSAVA
jgi:hypothetical protein